ncbi:MAG: DUF2815 family protein [Deltaproteobacteria bacterium]|nr:DUF2815 family protein [Deltaproteobacteria bacterium]
MLENVITSPFRVSYPQVFRSKHNDLNGKDEYSVVALFPKGADLSVLQKAANDAIVDKWGADKAKWPKPLRSPFRKHEEKEKDGKLPEGMEPGGIFISLRSIQRPGLVDGDRQPVIDETGFYAGCYARAQVRAYAYDMKGNKGVAFGLQNLQKMADGDPLSGRQKAEDAFEPVAGVAADADAGDPFGA